MKHKYFPDCPCLSCQAEVERLEKERYHKAIDAKDISKKLFEAVQAWQREAHKKEDYDDGEVY